jgi:hypothetical protein
MGEPVDKNLWGELEPEEGATACWVLIDYMPDDAL